MLSLHLSFYLASWGMYRGSSFLLQKDYRIHIPVIMELLSNKYDPLFCIECKDLYKLENKKLLDEVTYFIREYYGKVRLSVVEKIPKNKLSDTLITKILMGTFGCVPAYDRYFISGVKHEQVTTGNYNYSSLLKLDKNKGLKEAH